MVSFGAPKVPGIESGFDSPLESMTVAAGRSAHFTCVVKHLGGYKVRTLLYTSKTIMPEKRISTH